MLRFPFPFLLFRLFWNSPRLPHGHLSNIISLFPFLFGKGEVPLDSPRLAHGHLVPYDKEVPIAYFAGTLI